MTANEKSLITKKQQKLDNLFSIKKRVLGIKKIKNYFL